MVFSLAGSRQKIFGMMLLCSIILPSGVYGFKDIGIDDPAYIPSIYLKEKKIIKGYDDQTFRPHHILNRAETLQLLSTIKPVIADDLPKKDLPFTDIKPSDWFYPVVQTAYSEGIISGTSPTFEPGRFVNRAEFFKMLSHTFALDLENLDYQITVTDVSKTDWFSPYFNFAVLEKVLLPNENKQLNPSHFVSRGEAITWIFRFLKAGNVLDQKAVFTLAEKHIDIAIKNLIEQKSIIFAEKIATIAHTLVLHLRDRTQTNVQTAEKISQSLVFVIQGFRSLSEGNHEQSIVQAKSAWSTIDQIDNREQEIENTIKKIAENIANSARQKP